MEHFIKFNLVKKSFISLLDNSITRCQIQPMTHSLYFNSLCVYETSPNLFSVVLYAWGQPASAWSKDRKQLSSKQEVQIAEHILLLSIFKHGIAFILALGQPNVENPSILKTCGRLFLNEKGNVRNEENWSKGVTADVLGTALTELDLSFSMWQDQGVVHNNYSELACSFDCIFACIHYMSLFMLFCRFIILLLEITEEAKLQHVSESPKKSALK